MSPAHPTYPSAPTYRRQPTPPEDSTSLRLPSRSGRRAAILRLAGLTGVAAMFGVAPAGLAAFTPPAHAVQASVLTTPRAPAFTNVPGTENDTFTVFSNPGVDWFVNGVRLDAASLDRPQPMDGRWSLVIEARPQPGYTFPAGAQTTWSMIVDPPPMTVATETLADADRPTTRLSWSSARGVTYDVSYHKVLLNGSAGPEISWFTRTTRETADFVSGWGSQYVVTVIAYDAKGNRTETASASIAIIGDPVFGDIAPGVGTFNSAWQHLRNLGAQRLPYFGDTAALGFRGAAWQFQVPAGTRGLELYATVHPLGAKGRILVNGRDWADVETNTRYWGQVDDPYMYPVRRIQGWDSTRPATITVIVTDGGTNYLALDAYRTSR